ncbi:MAG: phosphohydrolase [Bdellovibrio sp. ArHS]|uniref:metallophosphoesterase family protein n=1 Tax=Bdellovibrio sp. ArHS TaxID=1569284 RepID=UPI0005830EEF|nr:metallophosphoesterase family protein [Bdellovibrio sp. ArHS]KHD86995.1 MAG: phosphohydrolase [Bdellovibrio sp. ArHS]
MSKLLFYVATFCLVSSCAPFVDSPFSDKLLRPERNLNQLALKKIGNPESDGVIRMAIYSDSHQNYKATDKMVFQMNQVSTFDFVAGLGDFTNSAYNLEYDEFIEAIGPLRHTLINVIGNHDSIGAGPELYRKAFGPSNFYFESDNYRFIVFNSNNLETPHEFDPEWLKARVDETGKNIIIFSHVQLRDSDRYFDSVATTLGYVIEHPRVKIIFNGHNHIYDLSTDHGTIMMQCGRVAGEEGTHWLSITVQGNQFCVTRMDTLGNTCLTIKP